MVKVVRTPGIARQYLTKSELYGGWPLHGMPDTISQSRQPMKRRRKQVDIIDNSELEQIIREADSCCCDPDE